MLRRLIFDQRAASAAEFALVLPLLLLLMFGIIDAGRYMWAINRAEKAVHMGVRMAVVTDFVSSAVGADYVGQCGGLAAGDPIPANCFSPVTCSRSGTAVTCTSGTVSTAQRDAFNRVLARVRTFMPEVQPNQMRILYAPSGLGYAGDSSGPDVAPLVTVALQNLTFRPIVTLALMNVGLPEVRSSMTLEDATGTQSN